MADAGEQFSHSLSKHGDAPPPQERRVQETQLFQFFSNGFSVFESYFYGLFAIGHFIDGPSFAIETARDQQAIGPARTRDAFSRSGLSAALVGSFDALFADAEYAELKVVRNILSHRAAPGRVMFAGLGSDVLQAAEWKINSIKLDATMTENRRKGMSRLLGGLLLDADRFVKAHSGVTP